MEDVLGIGTGCPPLLAGPNCTNTWREELNPWSSIIINGLLIGFILGDINMFIILFQTLKGKSWKVDSGMRLKTVISAVVTTSFWTIFFASDACMTHDIDTWQGKLSLISLMVGGVAFFQTANLFALMHIQVLNSRLEKKGYLDTVNMRIMRSIAIFWPYYIGIVIVTGFLIAGKIRNILRLLRVFFCLVSVMFATSVTFNAYYFVKVAKTIEKAAERRLSLHAHAQEGSRNPADEWKRIAWLSKFVGMYAFFIGGPVFILFIVFIVLNTFVNPTAMLVTWTIAGVGILSPIVIFTYWFKKGGLLVCFFDRKKPERRISRFMSVPDL